MEHGTRPPKLHHGKHGVNFYSVKSSLARTVQQHLQRDRHRQPAAGLYHHRRHMSICEGESNELWTPAGAAYLWSTGGTSNCIITVSTAAPIRSPSWTRTGAAASAARPSPSTRCRYAPSPAACPESGEGRSPSSARRRALLPTCGALTKTTNCITVSTAGASVRHRHGRERLQAACSATVTVNPLPSAPSPAT